MDIRDLMNESYETARDRGWHDQESSTSERIALMHSELSEALEEYRSGRPLDEIYYREDGKPEGFVVEIADVLIRIADFIRKNGLDDAFMRGLKEKLAFNKTRPYRHGGKVC